MEFDCPQEDILSIFFSFHFNVNKNAYEKDGLIPAEKTAFSDPMSKLLLTLIDGYVGLRDRAGINLTRAADF